jgi:ABC-2 type transport system ATP-binding protein
MPRPALELIGLSKRFGETLAVDNLDLVVPRGSFFGLVGPNGAGKTTSLWMAVGLLRPDRGTARVLGLDVWSDPERARTHVGVLPDSLMYPERLTGRELLTYVGLLRGLSKTVVTERAEELLQVLALDGAPDTLVVDYSTGMRKKIGLAAALLHAPRLLVLDEPFESVDPVSASTIRTILARLVASGGTVIFSSHVMPLVEQLCSHVAIVARGKVAATGTLDSVRNGRTLDDVFVDLVDAEGGGAEGLAWLAA